jgi:hypothetical protein
VRCRPLKPLEAAALSPLSGEFSIDLSEFARPLLPVWITPTPAVNPMWWAFSPVPKVMPRCDDTFFVHDRGLTSNFWSTVDKFHSGDAARIWDATPSDFDLSWVDRQGETGYLISPSGVGGAYDAKREFDQRRTYSLPL